MKTTILIWSISFVSLFYSQIKLNVNGANINIKGKGSNTNKENTTGTGSQSNNSDYAFERNPDAPLDVNNNLEAGAFCVVIDSRGNMSRKRVYQIVNGGYAIIDANATDWDLKNNANAIRYFAANSVYPDVDFTKFNNDLRPYEEYVKHYLNCFSQSNLPSLSVLTNWNQRWPAYYLGSVKEAKEHLFKLKSLDSLYQLKYASLPNFYTKYEYNPYVWGKIAQKRDSMVSCLLASSGDGQYGEQLKSLIAMYQEEISDAKSFTVGSDWKVSSEMIGIAVSKSSRAEWNEKFEGFFNDYSDFAKLVGKNPNIARDTLTLLMDKLATELKIALPKNKPEDYIFKYREASLESKMKAYLKNPSALTIYKIGLTHDTWQIAKKDNGLPDYKYKYGAMYVKNPTWDHSYCKVLYFTLKQDYAGGGTYGETHIGSYSESYFGCP